MKPLADVTDKEQGAAVKSTNKQVIYLSNEVF